VTNTWRDTAATTLAVMVVLAYLAHLAIDTVPVVDEVRGMAAVGMVLGIASRWLGGRSGFKHERWAMIANFASVALGIATLITGSVAVLAVFVASIVALWTAAAYVRFGGFHPHHPVAQ